MECNDGCCSGGCCGQKQQQVTIDFLYLDLQTCDRCQGTDAALDDAINDVGGVLKASGFDVIVNKVRVDTKDKAIAYELVSSPTIRVNGRDIDTDIKETQCDCCGDICGSDVDCRVWTYHEEEYTVPPKGLITSRILGAVFGEQPPDRQKPYKMPDNLVTFFDGVENQH